MNKVLPPARDEWTMTGALATNRTAPPIPFTSKWVRAEWADYEIERLRSLLLRYLPEHDGIFHNDLIGERKRCEECQLRSELERASHMKRERQ
jgi:hypothetical protein